MATPEVREVEKKFNLWGGFRDEMVATAMTLSLLVVGSFVLTQRLLSPTNPTTPPASPTATNQPQTLGIQDPAQSATPDPVSETIVPVQPASDSANMTQVPYGQNGDYDFDGYTISFRNPVLSFDKLTNEKRKLSVEVWIKNKSITDGIPMRLTASIIKDGVVIVPTAALYVPDSHTIAVGEDVTFTATLSLIEGTDVREIKYSPGDGITEASHFLYQ